MATEVTQIELGMPVYDGENNPIGTLEDIDVKGIRVDGRHMPMSAVERISRDGIYLQPFDPAQATSALNASTRNSGTGARNVYPSELQDTRGHVEAARGDAVAPTSPDTLRIPVMEERLVVEKRPTEGIVEVRTRVEEVEQRVNQALSRDEVEIERVRVDRPLDRPAVQRTEGEWLIVPVMEEVLVVEKRLMLREEIRIRSRQVTRDEVVTGTVKRHQVDVVPSGTTPATVIREVSPNSDPQSSPTP